MKIVKRALAVLGPAALIAVIFMLVTPKTAHSIVATLVEIVPGGTTHVGTTESNLVSLLCQPSFLGGGVGGACQSVDATGSVSGAASGYFVPDGSTLIVTDYEWNLTVAENPNNCCRASQPGSYLCDFFLQFRANGFIPEPAALLPLASCALTDNSGLAYGREHYTTGIRVASGIGIFDNLAALSLGSASIQGYLVPN